MISGTKFKRQLFKAFPVRKTRGTGKRDNLPRLGGKPQVATLSMTSTLAEGLEGSRGEILAMAWLQRQGIEFAAQQPILGGRQVKGGRVLDIIISEGMAQPLVIRIQSERYHGGSSEQEGDDIEEKVILINMGYQVIDIWEERLIVDVDWVMRQALMGIEVGR